MITIIKDMSMNLKLYQTTCKYCGSVFEHDQTDLIEDFTKNSSSKEIVCPICKKRVAASCIVSSDDIPKPPPPRPLKPKNAFYELISDYIISAKKNFKFKS